MKKIYSIFQRTSFLLLSGLAVVGGLTAQLGAGSASSWGVYQQELPEELKR